MNWKEFEDNIRRESKTHDSQIDGEALWNNIRRKKKNRGLIIWWISLGIAGVAAFFWLETIHFNQHEMLANKVVNTVETNIINDHKTELNSNEQFLKNNNKEIDKPSLHSDISQLSTSENNFNKSNKENVQKASATIKSIKKNTNKSIVHTDISTSNPENFEEVLASNFSVKNDKYAKEATINESNTNFTKKDSINSLNTITNELSNKNEYQALAEIESLPIRYVLPVMEDNKVEINALNVEPKNSQKKNQEWKYAIGLYAGTGLFSVDFVSDFKHKADKEIREKTESNFNFYQAGIRFNINKAILTKFDFGIQYTRYNSEFNWQKEWKTADTIAYITPNFYSNGFVDSSITQQAVTTYYNRRVQNFNSVSVFQVPIHFTPFTYTVNKLSLSPKLGFITSFIQTAEGRILDQGENILELSQNQVFNNKLLFSYEIGINGNYTLFSNRQLFLECFYGRDLSNRSVSNYYLKQKFQHYGIRAGWQIKF